MGSLVGVVGVVAYDSLGHDKQHLRPGMCSADPSDADQYGHAHSDPKPGLSVRPGRRVDPDAPRETHANPRRFMPGTDRGLHLGRLVGLVGLVAYNGVGHDKQHLRAGGSHMHIQGRFGLGVYSDRRRYVMPGWIHPDLL
jgi:hypothetical protein